jgi:hypothetical protein
MKIKQPVFGVISIVSGLLLIPFIGNIFAPNSFNWTRFDFAIAALFLLVLSTTVILIYKKLRNVKFRLMVIKLLIILFSMFWLELAVGIFNSPFSGK